MTEEEKELLLKDLSARAPYRVKICVLKGTRINTNGKIKEYDLIDTVYGVIFYEDEPRIVTPQNSSFLDKYRIQNFGGWSVEVVKPYLRPMSSMSEKERKEYLKHIVYTPEGRPCPTIESFDWLNEHHFDYRGLIEKGLAWEAPKGMYEQ